ncbi:hypothetical protein GCM10010346_63510 [Streptomyces chryseus]|uniref:Uncharacterized protein n=1 Tax=Streptomyces chryseus TaxID=68186 RepID=A0ABQ3EBS6_9ACTN|nr:hypothetical protein GCM10010346_63510 [Streptomyces chryseus]
MSLLQHLNDTRMWLALAYIAVTLPPAITWYASPLRSLLRHCAAAVRAVQVFLRGKLRGWLEGLLANPSEGSGPDDL